MDPETGSHPRWLTSGQDTWSARCTETRTPGAAGGPGKPTRSNPGRAPRSDPTGAFYKTELYPLLYRISAYLVRWIRKKYRRLKTFAKAHEAWKRITLQYPTLFAHWKWIHGFW